MTSPSPPVPDSNTDVSLNEVFERFRQQTFDRIKSCEKEVRTSKHHASLSCKENERLEAELKKVKSELDDFRSDYKDYRDTSQQEYTELQATSQQLIDKLQREIVDVTAQKEKYKERLDKFISFTQSFTPGKPEAKALAENGSDDVEEQPVSGIAASSVASPPADRHAVLDTSLQNKHFKKSGDEVEDEPSALKKSDELAEDEESEEDTSSPLDVLQEYSRLAGEEFGENEPGAKEEEDDVENEPVDVEEDEDDDGRNIDTLTLLPIAENQPVEVDELKLLTTPEKSIEDTCDEDDDAYATASEDMGEVTTRDAGSQTPPPSRKTRSSSSSVKRVAKSPKNKISSAKKQKRSGRRTQ